MKKTVINLLAVIICLQLLPANAAQARQLIPVGKVVGLEIRNDRVSVAAFDDALCRGAQAAGLQIGDEILCIDGIAVDEAADIRHALEKSDGQVTLRILRGKQEHDVSVTPAITGDGPRLGVYLRQGVTGIGTVTWYDPATGAFGTLGHGVNSANGQLVEMTSGTAYRAGVASVKRGKCGEPGQLRGEVDSGSVCGTLGKNTLRGVFGATDTGWQGTAVETAAFDQIRTGAATILSTVSGDTVREYSVEILKIYPNSHRDGRNMLLRVTDPELLAATGGIVQGMSGSPVLQDGKIIGAVTHVLVNDPTTGYGIFIENMLDAAS